MTLFLSYLINGISLGSVYAIIALGYTMVYGIAKMLNFAHGDVIMIGAYVSFCAMQYLGLPALVSVVLAMVACTALGIVIEGLAYKPLRQAPSLAVLITAIGVSYFLQNSALLIWGSAPKSYPSVITLGSINLMDGQLVISGGTIVTVPNLVGTEWSNAQVSLNIQGLKHQLQESQSSQSAAPVTYQYPHAGAKVPYGTTIYLYTDTYEGSRTEVPDVTGKSPDFARQMLSAAGLNCVVEGSGTVQAQSAEPGSSVQRGTIITLTCG